MPQFEEAFAKISLPRQKSDSASKAHEAMPALPLTEVPAQGPPKKIFAILLTGDGGWAGIDRDLAQSLAQKGIGIIGWNSLQYLWERKQEDKASQDLAQVISYYLDSWKKEKVVLLGYSLGADILPAMASRLPKEILDKVASIGLIGVETNYDLEFHVTDWIPGKAEGKPILPELLKLKGKRILCLYGKEEQGSLCPQLDSSLARSIPFEGGHHFGGDYNALAEALLK
jgi:type IV secretory pathway VirJ component